MSPLRFFTPRPPPPPLTDPLTIDRLFRRYRLSVITSITLGYGFMYTCRLGLSVVKKPLLDSHTFTATELGQIGSAIFYSYAVGKFVNGFLADHADVRKFFAAGLAASALVNLVMGFSPLFWVWVLLWGINGWFQGFGAPASAVSLTNWFTPQERGRFYGIWSLAHSLGEGLTFIVSALLIVHFGWRAAFVGPGLFCLLIAIALLIFLKDRPQTLGLPEVSDWHPSSRPAFPVIISPSPGTPGEGRGEGSIDNAFAANPTDPNAISSDDRKAIIPPIPLPYAPHPPISPSPHLPSHLLRSQLTLLLRPPIWILGLASATMYVSRYAINNWGILFLQEAKGYSLVQASFILGLNTLAGMAGAVVYGFLSDGLFHARRPPATLLYGLAETASLAAILYLPPGHPVLLSIAFAMFGFTLSGLLAVLGGLFAIDLVPKHATGAVMGIIGAFSYLGAALQDNLTGLLLDRHKTVTPTATHYDFTTPGLFWLASSLLSLLLAASLWNTKPKS